MRNANAIARERQRMNDALAAEMKEFIGPLPAATKTDGWTGYTSADMRAYAADAIRATQARCAAAVRATPTHTWVEGCDAWGSPMLVEVRTTREQYAQACEQA